MKFISDSRCRQWLFSPRMRSVIAWLSYLTRLLPVNLLSKLYHDWPLPQVHILQALLHSPATIHATLLMAYDEMQSIKDLDISLLDAHKSKLRFYFAEQDAWVGEERSNILRSFNPTPEDVQVVHGQQDIPHAFCISEKSKSFRHNMIQTHSACQQTTEKLLLYNVINGLSILSGELLPNLLKRLQEDS